MKFLTPDKGTNFELDGYEFGYINRVEELWLCMKAKP